MKLTTIADMLEVFKGKSLDTPIVVDINEVDGSFLTITAMSILPADPEGDNNEDSISTPEMICFDAERTSLRSIKGEGAEV